MKTAGVVAKLLDPGKYLLVVTDKSKADNLHLKGPGVNKATSVKGTGTQRWSLTLKPGTYTFSSDAHSKLRGSFRVS
jgi:hypothetical protein